MEAELVVLATGAASAFVSAAGSRMAEDVWEQFKRRMGRLLGRGRHPAVVGAEVDLARAEILAAEEIGDEEAPRRIRAGWQEGLADFLRADPLAAADVRALMVEAEQLAEAARTTVVRNEIGGNVRARDIFQIGTVGGNLQVGGAGEHSADVNPRGRG